MGRACFWLWIFGSLLASDGKADEAPSAAPVRLPPVEAEASPELAAVVEYGMIVYPITPFAEIELPLPLSDPPPVACPPAEKPKKPVKLWEGSVQLGLDGSSGNRDAFNIRAGADVKRKTKVHVLSASIDYYTNRSTRGEPTNRLSQDARYERLFGESPLSWFTRETFLYDESQDFDSRLTADTGMGYRFVDRDDFKLAGRLGGGFSREFGGPDDEFVPELVLGTDYEYRLTERQKITLTADYTPDVTDPGDYRIVSKAAWEALLDEEVNLSLKFSVTDRYDSTPHGAKPNDIDYSAVLLWKF